MEEQPRTNRILLVSNDSTVRESLEPMLSPHGFTVLLAESGRRAAKMLSEHGIGIIVLDYKTPFDPSGATSRKSVTLEKLTDLDPFRPLVLVCPPEVELDRAESLMADMVLRHPVAPGELLDAVETLSSETMKERALRKAGRVAILR